MNRDLNVEHYYEKVKWDYDLIHKLRDPLLKIFQSVHSEDAQYWVEPRFRATVRQDFVDMFEMKSNKVEFSLGHFPYSGFDSRYINLSNFMINDENHIGDISMPILALENCEVSFEGFDLDEYLEDHEYYDKWFLLLIPRWKAIRNFVIKEEHLALYGNWLEHLFMKATEDFDLLNNDKAWDTAKWIRNEYKDFIKTNRVHKSNFNNVAAIMNRQDLILEII